MRLIDTTGRSAPAHPLSPSSDLQLRLTATSRSTKPRSTSRGSATGDVAALGGPSRSRVHRPARRAPAARSRRASAARSTVRTAQCAPGRQAGAVEPDAARPRRRAPRRAARSRVARQASVAGWATRSSATAMYAGASTISPRRRGRADRRWDHEIVRQRHGRAHAPGALVVARRPSTSASPGGTGSRLARARTRCRCARCRTAPPARSGRTPGAARRPRRTRRRSRRPARRGRRTRARCRPGADRLPAPLTYLVSVYWVWTARRAPRRRRAQPPRGPASRAGRPAQQRGERHAGARRARARRA